MGSVLPRVLIPWKGAKVQSLVASLKPSFPKRCLQNRTLQTCLNASGKRKIPPSAKNKPRPPEHQKLPPPLHDSPPQGALWQRKGALSKALRGMFLGGGEPVCPPEQKWLPIGQEQGRGGGAKEWGSPTPGPGSLTSQARPVMGARAEIQPAAVWGG